MKLETKIGRPPLPDSERADSQIQLRVEAIQAEINAKYPAKLVCEIPEHEFHCGGLIWNITTRTGHHSGMATICGLGLLNIAASNLLNHLQ